MGLAVFIQSSVLNHCACSLTIIRLVWCVCCFLLLLFVVVVVFLGGGDFGVVSALRRHSTVLQSRMHIILCLYSTVVFCYTRACNISLVVIFCALRMRGTKGLSTREAGRGHATPHMPVETAKCWWLLKIEPNAWAGGKGSCAVCVDLQAVGALEFFGELYSLAKGFGPFLSEVCAGFREREGSIFSNHQHFAVSTGICEVACPLPAWRVDKPLAEQ